MHFDDKSSRVAQAAMNEGLRSSRPDDYRDAQRSHCQITQGRLDRVTKRVAASAPRSSDVVLYKTIADAKADGEETCTPKLHMAIDAIRFQLDEPLLASCRCAVTLKQPAESGFALHLFGFRH